MVVALIAYFIIPKSIEDASFLTRAEKDICRQRHYTDSSNENEEDDKFSVTKYFEPLKDRMLYVYGLIALSCELITYRNLLFSLTRSFACSQTVCPSRRSATGFLKLSDVSDTTSYARMHSQFRPTQQVLWCCSSSPGTRTARINAPGT